jgi:hypothetical protein
MSAVSKRISTGQGGNGTDSFSNFKKGDCLLCFFFVFEELPKQFQTLLFSELINNGPSIKYISCLKLILRRINKIKLKTIFP